MSLVRLCSSVLVVTLAACSTLDIRSDYDPEANFGGLKTYDWMPDPKTGDPRVDNALVVKRITTAIDAELAAKGYTHITSGDPDFYVGYHAAVKDKLDVRTMNTYYGYAPGWGWNYGYGGGPYGTETYTYEYEEGTLMIDVVEPENKKLIWRGSAQAELKRRQTPEQSEQGIREAVQKVLANFPPDAGKKKTSN